jgi:hypothetical protein
MKLVLLIYEVRVWRPFYFASTSVEMTSSIISDGPSFDDVILFLTSIVMLED